MRSKLACAAILVATTAGLSGCSYLRATGPCFGTGCPSRTIGQNGQYKLGQGPKTGANPAQAIKATVAPPQQTPAK
jgi:hypothetical protein